MSNKATAAAQTAPTDNVASFAMETCFTRDERLRDVRAPVRFRLTTVGRALGKRVDVEFVSDYGVYYDADDDYLIGILKRVAPGVDWDRPVYYRLPDFSKIHLLDGDTGRVVAQVATMKYGGKPVQAEDADSGRHGENVISFASLPARRAAIQAGESQGE